MKAMSGLHSRWTRGGLAVIVVMLLGLVTRPAQACGCGIYLPQEGEASVSEEHVLIRWDGQTEDIVMTLGVLGSSKEAAVIFPVPTPATVQLADGDLFAALRELTKPIVKTVIDILPIRDLFAGAGGGMLPYVTLLKRQELGPFDVSTLAANDTNALGDWLKDNGYNLAPEVVSVLEPYVAQGWYYIAVRISPGAGADELSGALDPLWITFPSDKIIYPMRPSALAREGLMVFMYVLADHRVQKPMSFGYEVVQYADWVEPAALAPDSPLAPFVTKKLFLTKIAEDIYQPESITDDFVFEFTAQDEIYHTIEYRYIDNLAGIPLCLLIPCTFGLVVVGGGLAIGAGLRRRRKAHTTL